MSGGSRAERGGKRGGGGGRGQGWEEAGAEFYQESYPGAAGCSELDAEAAALHRDAQHLATMLPSKQAQHTLARATTRRRSEAKQATRKRTSTRTRSRYNTVRRGSTTNDVQVSMLPDFTENFPNEERTWEEIMQIKSMPVSMAQKRELKAKLQSATKLRLQGLEQFKWQRRKFWQQFRANWKEFYSKLGLWQSSLKTIEGNFGIGVMAYFLFIKWLMLLNLAVLGLLLVLVVLPQLLLPQEPPQDCEEGWGNATWQCCSEEYANVTTPPPFSGNQSLASNLIDLIQGTGWMEKTCLFYGFYTNSVFRWEHAGTEWFYDLPLAYIAAAVLYFLLSLVAIVKSSARGFKERLVEGEGQFYQYSNLVFGGWDFCIDNEKGAVNKHKALFYEFKGLLEGDRLDEEKLHRSRQDKIKLFFLRLLVNILILGVLAGAGGLIIFTFSKSLELLETETQYSKYLTLLYEYMPYLVIVALNLLVPFLFAFLVSFEQYTPIFVVRITLMRTVLLRLASLGVLAAAIYQLVSCSDGGGEECHCKHAPLCWETYVGQQFYKLTILDAVAGVLLTFLFNFPRALLARHVRSQGAVGRFIRFIGEQEFELPRHVLDIVYSQTLYWIGSFFAPLLPVLATIHLFFSFYIKKFACLVNSTPSSNVYRASRSHSLFMTVLLLSYTLAAIVIGYSIAEVYPSRACGPFRGKSNVWEVVTDTFDKLPEWVRDCALFVGTAGFAVPLIVVLLLALYYYWAVTATNRQMVVVLRQQLVLEGHDKQFLLSRLSTIIKQQQERLRPRSRAAQVAHQDLSQSTDVNSDNS